MCGGNLVYTNRAHGKGEKQKKTVEINLHYLRQIEDNCNYIEPIPLTEEWLLKFGFEMYEFDHKANQFRFKERLIVYIDGFLYDHGTSVKLQYVHQLQNLSFALTNEELTIK